MADTPEATRHARSLALKLALWLVLAGGVFVAALMFVVARILARSGAATRLLTERHDSVTAGGVAWLTAAIIVLIALAFTTSVVRIASTTMGDALADSDGKPPRRSPRRLRSILILAVGLLCFAGALGLRWSRSTSSGSPALGVEGIRRP